jgi:TonB family protein
MAQPLLSGKVLGNDTQMPVFGAEVYVKRGDATITNFNGEFEIHANIGDVLRIVAYGYKKEKIEIQNHEELEVMLVSKNEEAITEIVNTGSRDDTLTNLELNTPREKKKTRKRKKGIVRGKLMSGEDGYPVAMAYIINLNSSRNTLSDLDGNFEIKADSGMILQVVAKGYKKQHVYIRNDKDISIMLTKPPEFKGGKTELNKYIAENLKYPESAISNNIEGTVHIEFEVNTDGSLTNLKVVKSISPDLDNEAIRLLKSFPRFIPGYANLKPIKMKMIIPISFKMPME